MLSQLALALLLNVSGAQKARVFVAEPVSEGPNGRVMVFRAHEDGPKDLEAVERRLKAAGRLLERAAIEIEEDRPGRALALIRTARTLMGRGNERGGEENVAIAVGAEPVVEAHSEVHSETHSEARVEAVDGKPTVRVEIRTRIQKDDGTEEEKVEVREFTVDGKGIVHGEGGEGIQIRLAEPVDGVVDVEAVKPEVGDREDADEGEKPVGVGFLLEAEDGEYVVRRILPGSPAADEGSIHPGDRIVGVVDTDGVTRELGGKSIEEVVNWIRGQAGTKVKLIVIAEGDDDRATRVVELKRRPLEVPQANDGDDEDGDEDE